MASNFYSESSDFDIVEKHYKLFKSYLKTQKLQKANSVVRNNARDRLQRLLNTDFIETSIDVFDELSRKKLNAPEILFLPIKLDLPSSKNAARQRLATLPLQRFQLLTSDVMWEIENRFPLILQRYSTRITPFEKNRGRSMEPLRRNLTNSNRTDTGKNLSSPGPIYSYRSSSVPKRQKALEPFQNNQKNPLSTLDNLMSDLGGVINNEVQIRHADEMEKMKVEYEREIEDLKNALAHDDQEAFSIRIDFLEVENRKLAEEKEGVDVLLSKVTTDYSMLKEDHEHLLDEFKTQKTMGADIRTQAAVLLQENKSLLQKIEDLEAEIFQTNRSNGREKIPPNSIQTSLQQPNMPNTNNIIISKERIDFYQKAISNFFYSSDCSEKTLILISMKEVVLACKSITEDAETSTIEAQREHEMYRLKDRLSDCLGILMVSAKNHANGNSDAELLETPASDLTNAVFDLVDFLNLTTPASLLDSGVDMTMGDLKLYLVNQTDQIVQAIQLLMQIMRNSTEFGDYFLGIVKELTTLVDEVVYFTRNALDSNPGLEDYLMKDGESIVFDLQSCGVELKGLGNDMVNGDQSNSLKQRLASSSYEIAKFVKELVNLFE